MGSGYDTDIHLDFMTAAHREKFLIIKNRQKFHLKRKGQITNLGKKYRTILGKAEHTGLVFDSTGKSAPHMAKKFGFKQGLRQCATIYLDKRISRSL